MVIKLYVQSNSHPNVPSRPSLIYLKKNIIRRFDDWRGLEEGTWRPRHLQRRGLGSREGDITSEDDLGFSSDAYTQQVANYLGSSL